MHRTVEDKPCSKLIKETALKSFYVDDLLKSVQEFHEAVEVVIELKKVLKYGGFNLTKFVTSDVQLLKSIEVGDRAKEVKEITPELYSKVLGIKWDVTEDNFYYVDKLKEKQDQVTKRNILSQVSSTYDPLGLISPVVLKES